MGALLRRYADFHGRAKRREFWLVVLIALLAPPIAGAADMIFSYQLMIKYGLIGLHQAAMHSHGPLLSLTLLALVVPVLAVCVRRLHDIGRTGWWIALGLIRIVGWIALAALSIIPGSKGLNRFGDKATPVAFEPASVLIAT